MLSKERHQNATGPDREQHDIAFIPLDVFQVFNDDGFFAIIFKEPFQIGVLAAFFVQQVEDQPLLLSVKSDNAERKALFFGQGEPFRQATHYHAGDRAGFVLVSAPHTTGIGAIDLVQLHRLRLCGWRREGHQSSAIVTPVGECDKGFIPAAGVPVELLGRDASGGHLVKDRGEVFFAFRQVFFCVLGAAKFVLQTIFWLRE